MLNLEYEELYSEQSIGDMGAFGFKILVAGNNLPNLDIPKIRDAVYRASASITAEIKAAIKEVDPNTKEYAELQRKQVLSLFPDAIFVEEIPNGYCSDWCCRELPWFIVTTKIGHFKVGWRKRVINIDWSRTKNTKKADELFPGEDVTKGDYSIHAWSLEDARKYVNTVLQG